MIIYLIRKDEIISLRLPSTYMGNYWISYKNENNDVVNLINIEADNNNYIAKSNIDAEIQINGQIVKSVILNNYNYYPIRVKNEVMYLYVVPLYDNSFSQYIIGMNEITIGKSESCNIIYNNSFISDLHAKIVKIESGMQINSLDNAFGVYVNKKKISQKLLFPGDIIFIAGLRIIYMGSFWIVNNPNNLVKLSGQNISLRQNVVSSNSVVKSDPYLVLYNESDYFEKSPRFITEFERGKIVIDPPPTKKEESETSLLITIGPMMTMGLTSMITAWQAISRMINHGDISEYLPSLIMSIAMIMTMIMWPILSLRFQKKQDLKKEAERQSKYKDYLKRKSDEIATMMNREKQVLMENNVSLEECQNIIFNKKRNLWEKEIFHSDFLTVRLGVGSIKPNIEISYPDDHFSLSEDNLKDLLVQTIERKNMISEVPIKISLTEKNISAIIGDEDLTDKFLESILLQLMTFQSYRDLKIVFLKSSYDEKYNYLKYSPYLFTDDMMFRFYGENMDDIDQISNYLTQIIHQRKYDDEGNINQNDYRSFSTYYLIIADNDLKIKHTSIVKEIMDSNINYGFSILFRSNNLSSLPKECSTFITIDGDNGKTSGYFENELTSDKQQPFAADLNIKNRINIIKCVEALSKIPLRLKDSSQKIPKSLSFLEMYNVGMVEQLNAEFRWQNNDPTVSLAVPIGVDENNELFKLDIHEKRYGPHGLIAGMTGSGKSELIITYILSMAINFHPYEVSFVLIDYKGGGLTGAFENHNKELVLPHIAGTITNLDVSTINRALASIHSELERRQVLFNEAREKLGESTIDIYKYQRFYREGKVDKPISHLIIISDEFAELKSQRPEFMQELISTARIGRSLGVHLILATQKPSGIVDEQIWSNSKFRISLRVQNKADSNDVIGRDDAASLTDVGRFYLSVGYNELFAVGQSAYTGLPYYPEEKKMKKIDTSLNFIDNIGNVIKTANDDVITLKPSGEELTNIVNYLINVSNDNNIHIDKLWLDNLHNIIYLSDLKNKYNYNAVKHIINPVIGEFDDPSRQRQGLFTLPLSKDGNTIVYGTTGSGKEDFLTTMIYSIITSHDASEVSLYILDFGSESLKLFKNAPQIGDVVTISEDEKVINLFKMLQVLIDQRKTLLAKYNGDFGLYNEKEDIPLSTYVIVINNYEAFVESYESCNDMLSILSRECLRYGIVFVLTCSSVNSVRYRISQNFKQLIPLQLNDKLDYRTILGNVDIVPSEIVGRGLVKIDDVYEFQTAIISDRENQTDIIKNTCEQLKSSDNNSANPIPVLPLKVTSSMLEKYIDKPKNGYYPVGIYKDDLKVGALNFKNNYATIISSMDYDLFGNFLNPLIEEFTNKYKVVVLDTLDVINKSDDIEYHNSNFDAVINNISNYVDKLYELYESHNFDLSSIDNTKDIVCVISGVGNLLKRLENKSAFEEVFIKASEIKKVSFILVDTTTVLRKYEYDEWYKMVTQNSGIWLGSGINDQMTIKLSQVNGESKKELSNSYGFIINKGIARLAKLLEGDSNGK